MSRLYLRCVICSRQQADGLISGAAWGRLELPEDAQVDHPGVNGSTLRACPSCVGSQPDWQERILGVLGISAGHMSQPQPDAAR
jgi:hypothetical protein